MNISNWFLINVFLFIVTSAISTKMGFNVLTWQYWALLIIVGISNVAGFIEGFKK